MLSYQRDLGAQSVTKVPRLQGIEQAVEMNDVRLGVSHGTMQASRNAPTGHARCESARHETVLHSAPHEPRLAMEPLYHRDVGSFFLKSGSPAGQGMKVVEQPIWLLVAGEMAVVDEQDSHECQGSYRVGAALIRCSQLDPILANVHRRRIDQDGGVHPRGDAFHVGVVRGVLVKEALRRFLQGSFESLWATLFRLAASTSPADLRMLSIGKGARQRRVMVVAPHPDDEVAGCAFAMLAHRDAGDRVEVLCVSDGRRSTAFGLSSREMASRRQREARAAAEMLDFELCWLGLPEGEWQEGQLEVALEESLSSFRPDLVYAPSALDFHPEHQKVARVLASILIAVESAPLVRIYEIQVPLVPAAANRLLHPVPKERIEAALGCHASQLGSLLCCLRRRRYAASLAGLAGYAEAFWELDVEGYALLHEPPPPASSFRGLRYWAFSDPLAYLRGREQRQLCRDRLAEGSP